MNPIKITIVLMAAVALVAGQCSGGGGSRRNGLAELAKMAGLDVSEIPGASEGSGSGKSSSKPSSASSAGGAKGTKSKESDSDGDCSGGNCPGEYSENVDC